MTIIEPDSYTELSSLEFSQSCHVSSIQPSEIFCAFLSMFEAISDCIVNYKLTSSQRDPQRRIIHQRVRLACLSALQLTGIFLYRGTQVI